MLSSRGKVSTFWETQRLRLIHQKVFWSGNWGTRFPSRFCTLTPNTGLQFLLFKVNGYSKSFKELIICFKTFSPFPNITTHTKILEISIKFEYWFFHWVMSHSTLFLAINLNKKFLLDIVFSLDFDYITLSMNWKLTRELFPHKLMT